jgi:hypothetical protein
MTVEWDGIWSLGKQSDRYFEAEYRGMHCELFLTDNFGHTPMQWEWSFYDPRDGAHALAVARGEGAATMEVATEDMVGYIDGWLPEVTA